MPLASSHEQEVRRFWAALLGVDEQWLDTDQVVLVPQFFDDEQPTIYLFQRGSGVIVSVVAKAPAQALNLAEAALRGRPPAEVFERDLWIEAFTFRCERVTGPSWVGHADPTTFRFVGGAAARVLQAADRPALAAFRAAMPDGEWEAAGLDLAAESLHGVFHEDGRLLALAGTEQWGRHIAALSAATLPSERGKGHASAALKAAGRNALGEGSVLQARCLESDAAAMRLARALGFQPWGRTMSVRLKPLNL
jgi:GNAT superfamily N-acetyltransferase